MGYLDGFVSRTCTVSVDPFYLQLAKALQDEEGILSFTIGKAFNTRYSPPNCTLNIYPRNYSFVFYDNIALHYSNLNAQAIVNWTTAHELLHQIGNVWDADAHDVHDNTTPCKCVLKNAPQCYPFVSADEKKFEVCPRHEEALNDGPDLSPTFTTSKPTEIKNAVWVSSQNNNLASNHNLEESDLKITLEKKKFKKYEPILVMFEYVNKNSDIDTVRLDFTDEYDETSFIIETDNNKIYNTRNRTPLSTTYFNGPRYFLPPNDTFIASMTLNYKYGEELKDLVPFDMYAFLKPGKYKVTAKTTIDGKEYISNKEEFEVVDLSSEDITVLGLVANKNIDELLKNYPENSFTEHALVRDVISRRVGTENNPPTKEERINDYKEFFYRFPNSFYNINSIVIESFLGKLANSSQNYFQDIENIKNQYPGSLLYRVLNKEYFIRGYHERLKKSHEFMKEVDKKNKEKQNKNK